MTLNAVRTVPRKMMVGQKGITMKAPCLFALVSIGCAALAGNAYGSMLAYDGFSYDVGNMPNNSLAGGSGWAAAWQNVWNTPTIASGSLTPAGSASNLPVSGNMASVTNQRAGRFLDCTAGGVFADYLDGSGHIGKDGTTLYLSFVMQPSRVTSDFYAFELKKDSLGDSGLIGGIGNNFWSDNNVSVEVNHNHTIVSSVDTSPALYVLCIDYQAGNDSVKVYVNPSLGTEPAVPTLIWANAGDLSFNGVSFCTYTSDSSVSLNVDEIRIGTTYESVTTPEPGTAALLMTGLFSLVAGARRIRRCQGENPSGERKRTPSMVRRIPLKTMPG